MTADILVPISVGELLDKITILELKQRHIRDAAKLVNVETELSALNAVRQSGVPDSPALADLVARLAAVNAALWTIEDDIRICERNGDFGDGFVALARSVYHQNDERARLKKEINLLVGSTLVEEKSYA